MNINALKQKGQKREMGFIAQEMEKVCSETFVNVSNLLHIPENENDNYSIAYGQLVVPLVNAIQEQQIELEELKTQNYSLQIQIDVLNNQMQTLIATTEKLLSTNEKFAKQVNK